jgi:hypothetical protein
MWARVSACSLDIKSCICLSNLLPQIFLKLGTTSNAGMKEIRKRKANFEYDVPQGYKVLCIVRQRWCPGRGVGVSLENVLVVDELTLGGSKCVAPTTHCNIGLTLNLTGTLTLKILHLYSLLFP